MPPPPGVLGFKKNSPLGKKNGPKETGVRGQKQRGKRPPFNFWGGRGLGIALGLPWPKLLVKEGLVIPAIAILKSGGASRA